jgi:hypothetical protein
MSTRQRMVAVLLVLVVAACAQMSGVVGRGQPEKVALWNGKNFDGWVLLGSTGRKEDPKWMLKEFSPNDPDSAWEIGDGVIACKGLPAGYMRTEKVYADYKLHVEWRWPGQAGNSGVIIHMTGEDRKWPKSIECQLMSSNAGDFFIIEGTEFKEHKEQAGDSRKTAKLGESAENPVGEWNAYDIICKGDTITVYVNGQLKNKATETSVTAGYICLQSEGRPIEFRNVYIEPAD